MAITKPNEKIKMAKRAKQRINCVNFSWNLHQRNGVYYADGRHNSASLGKYSLGTRKYELAIEALRQLDQAKAIDAGIIKVDTPQERSEIPIAAVWARYLDYCGRPEVLRGVGLSTVKRYRAVRDKHVEYCQKRFVFSWQSVDKRSVEEYGIYLRASKNGLLDYEVFWNKSSHNPRS
jgi:hypothetical protein